MAAYDAKSEEEHWYPNHKRESNLEAFYAGHYRLGWNHSWASHAFEETTPIPPMSCIDKDDDEGPYHCRPHTKPTLQIFFIKVAEIKEGLQWPLQVFGMIAARDVLDFRKRNIIFARSRNNCQTITQEHPYLSLAGPTRAIVVDFDPGIFEAELKVKGITESEDKDLSFFYVQFRENKYSFDRYYTSKRSTLELACCVIEDSVEATISLRLVGASTWPDGSQCVFTASISGIDDLEVLLLATGDDNESLAIAADDGLIKLTRRVVSVKLKGGKLRVSVAAQHAQITRRDDIVFTPKKAGRSCGVLNVGACKLQVTVAWSLFSTY